ncbi:MAG: YkgJ family cysteine cluster protein [Phycisphaeraceae bacterium]|nr:MAG: YkgJ family cysteine cluster protein [Phycisphaeraceae bacterium]
MSGGEWYEDGLRFECTMCGQCCTGAPGFVTFTKQEGRAIAARLGVTEAEFLARYTHAMPDGRRSLNERETEFGNDCIFLDRETLPGKAVCSLYEDRPLQCRTFPWWPDNLRSASAWRRAARQCEGIGQGRLVPVEEIRISRDAQTGRDRAVNR